MLALMRERRFVERLHDDLDLLFEHFTVGVVVGVGARDAEGVNLTGVVAPSYTEDDPPLGEDVRGGVVFCQAERVPHRIDVEPAAESQVLGQVGQVDVHHQQIGDALVALVLEMVLSRPKCVVAEFVHLDSDGLGLGKHRG